MFSKATRRAALSLKLGSLLAVFCLATLCLPQLAPAEQILGDVTGTYVFDGQSVTAHGLGALVVLANSSDYEWWYGCSPTSAGMIMGHYDRNGYAGDGFPNLVPGGVAEPETYVGPPTGWGALANNAIASQGHVGDFYIAGYGASGDDASPPWHDFDCLADFMGTSQDACGNSNGGTTFYYYTNGSRFHAANAWAHAVEDSSGMYGICEYVDYRGYGSGDPTTDTNYFNQYIIEMGTTYGFTWDQYKAEINAGRPVMIHVEGHSMYGYGYDDTGGARNVILNDTWSPGPHTMPWAGSYSGLQHYAVTSVTLIPEPGTMFLLALGGVAVFIRRRRGAA